MRTIKAIRQVLPICLCISMLGGCGDTATVSTSSAATEAAQSMTVEAAADIIDWEDSNIDWKNEEYKTIRLEEGAAEISASGIYELTGSLKNGSITVNTDKTYDEGTVYLVLNGVSVESGTSAPIYVKEAGKVVIILEDKTVNTVTQGSQVTADENGEPDSAIFSKADLTITGTGTLQVVSEYGDGIKSKDNLVISGGIIQVSAVEDGISGKDMLAVETADITIDAGKDGMRSTNDTDEAKGNIIIYDGIFKINAANDAIQAEQVLQIDGGLFDLSSGGGYPGQSIKINDDLGKGGDGRMGMRPDWNTDGAANNNALVETAIAETTDAETAVEETSAAVTAAANMEESKKAIKAGAQVILNGGTYNISSYEDAIHSNGTVEINGGIFNIETGDDAVHGDGAVTLLSGEITIKNSNEGIEGTNITVKDGIITLTSSDDGMNVSDAAGTLTIDGGAITIKSGGDGIDSNGNIVINGGTIVVHSDTIGAGDTPIDYDGTCTVNGGTLTDQSGAAINYENQQRGGGRPQGRRGGLPDESGS